MRSVRSPVNATRRSCIYITLGGFTYWVPDMLVQWVRPPRQLWLTALTLLVPTIVVGAWFLLARQQRHYEHRRSLALLMLLGVWLIGPLGIAVGMIPSGGTFLTGAGISHFLALWVMFPVTTFVLSTYSGSLGGVILVTLALCIAAALSGKLSRASNYRIERP